MMDIHLYNFSLAYVGNEISDYICRVSFYPGFKELFIHLSFFFSFRDKREGEGKITCLFHLKSDIYQYFHELTH